MISQSPHIKYLPFWLVTPRATTNSPHFEEKNKIENALHLYISILGINDAVYPI